MTNYTNRYGDEFTFELNERGNIQWSGEFKYCRFAGNDTITMVDPAFHSQSGYFLNKQESYNIMLKVKEVFETRQR